MQTIYKVFLVVFLVFIGFNLYVIDWQLGIFDDENAKFLVSAGAGFIGLILVFVMNMWSKIGVKKEI